MLVQYSFVFDSSTNMLSVAPIIITLICFVAYWFVAQSALLKNKFYSKYVPDVASTNHIIFNRYFGFFTMGIVSVMLLKLVVPHFTFSSIGLTIYRETIWETIGWIVGLSAVVIPIAYFSAKKPKNLVNYPQIRAKVWTHRMMWHNAHSWAAYLLGYELLFRGVLLFPVVETLGVWPAIAINTALYSATHIPKGLDETIGAAFLGTVLCLLTLSTGTIWIAVIVHIAMAWTNSFTALKFHPHMKIVD
jgi:membrane protease YdiL (CAAX protease family)